MAEIRDNPPYLGLDPVQEGEPRVWFNVVPDPTPGKNRLHLDVNLKEAGEPPRQVRAISRSFQSVILSTLVNGSMIYTTTTCANGVSGA